MVEKKYVGLINYFVEDILKKEDYGSTPLMIASGKGNKEIVKYLIENGAKVNEKNGNCWTSLTYAFRNGHDDVANYLKANGANLF
ncbi:hypothetical protein BCR32DRAFT_325484 [Anaeromyces robustus]|uniref:Uncharacterized protein n=1 Tax=Anaeromyces robustus TaxID=1754192 RepID=A0A1Y1XHU1_9FUNG|nr:hypothetical protein BCR32DRAFT_325484 [Anaeromyces robustus]|eukprot:ORX85328.1 hypothetical protein BCR32DRAFT_325484 [Anaeromyces robustus]